MLSASGSSFEAELFLTSEPVFRWDTATHSQLEAVIAEALGTDADTELLPFRPSDSEGAPIGRGRGDWSLMGRKKMLAFSMCKNQGSAFPWPAQGLDICMVPGSN